MHTENVRQLQLPPYRDISGKDQSYTGFFFFFKGAYQSGAYSSTMNITQNAKDCRPQQPCAVSSCSFSPKLTSQLIFCQDKAAKPETPIHSPYDRWMGRCKYNNAVMCITQHWRNNSLHHHFEPPIVDFFHLLSAGT